MLHDGWTDPSSAFARDLVTIERMILLPLRCIQISQYFRNLCLIFGARNLYR